MKRNNIILMIIFLLIAAAILSVFLYYHFKLISSLEDFTAVDDDAAVLQLPETLEELIGYTKECDHAGLPDARIHLGLIKHNPEYLSLVAEGYTLKEACRDNEQIFVFMDFQEGYDDFVDASAALSELNAARKKAVVGSTEDLDYSTLRLATVELADYGFGDRRSSPCHSRRLDDLNMIYFDCVDIGGDVKTDYSYHYNIPDDELLLFDFSRNYSPDEEGGMKIFTDVDLGFSFNYPSEWGDVTTKISESAVGAMDLVEDGRTYSLQFTKTDDNFPLRIYAHAPDFSVWEGPNYPGWQFGMDAEEYCELFAGSTLTSYGCVSPEGESCVDLDYSQIEYGICCPIGLYKNSFVELNDDVFAGLIVRTEYLIHEEAETDKEELKTIADGLYEAMGEAPHDSLRPYSDLVQSIKLK